MMVPWAFGTVSWIRPRRLFRSPITAPMNSSGVLTSTVMIGSKRTGVAGSLGADHDGGGQHAGRIHGGGDRGPEQPPRPDPGYRAEGPRYHHQGRGPAGRDAEIFLDLELPDGRARDLFYGFLDIRGSAPRAGGADPRGAEGGESGSRPVRPPFRLFLFRAQD